MSEETVAPPQTPAEVDLLVLRALTTKTLTELIALASTVLVRDVAAATEAARHVDLAKAALKEAQAELERARTVSEGARTALPGEGWSPQGAAAKAALISSFLG
jgi:hypothetical protein